MIEKQLQTQRGIVYYWISDSFNENLDTMVFLHGLSADHTLFDKQVDYFKDKYNIIVWDAPAHGKSRPYDDFTYFNAANDLVFILSENNVDSAIMVGQSMGGYIIQSFLLLYPEKVKAFIGIDTCPYGTEYYSSSDLWWLGQMEWMCSLFTEKALKKSVAKQCSVTDYAYNNMLKALEPYSKKELCHLYGLGYGGFADANQDMMIRCPVLIIVGDEDKTGKVKKYCRAWAEKTGYPLKVIKNAAHNSNADNPDEVNKAIEKFVQKLSNENACIK